MEGFRTFFFLIKIFHIILQAVSLCAPNKLLHQFLHHLEISTINGFNFYFQSSNIFTVSVSPHTISAQRTLPVSLSFSHTLLHMRAVSCSLSRSFFLSYIHTLTVSLTHSLTFSLLHTRTHAHTHCDIHDGGTHEHYTKRSVFNNRNEAPSIARSLFEKCSVS